MPKVLLVEDDQVDIIAVQRVFARKGLNQELVVAHDGLQALSMLRGEKGYERLERPVLIVLDLKMPRMGGIEFLRKLRRDQDPDIRDIPVVVLTSSDLGRDLEATRELQVSGYFVKDKEFEQFVEVLAELGEME